MKTKFSPAVIGAFVIGAFTLIIIALLAFGGVNFFSKPQRFVVYFEESIHGLDLGSPVKLNGVRVGRVVDLNIRYDEATNKSVVAVVCELSKNILTDAKGHIIDVSGRNELQELIDHGLRAQLGFLGFATGLLFVELDFRDPKDYPADDQRTEIKYAVVPAVKSAISEVQASAIEIMANLQKVDFAGLSVELKSLLVATHKQVDGLDLPGMAAQWKKTGVAVEQAVSAPEIKQTFANLNAAVTDLRTVLAKLDTQVMPAGKELTATLAQAKATLESFNSAANDTRRFIAAQGGLGDEVAHTLAQLGEAADSVQRLADYLERNPNALIAGKKRP